MTDRTKFPAPRKRLALFFDGTWNKPENNTNVWRLKLMLADCGEDGLEQRAFYDEGVGTHWYDRLTGGAFGAGLCENIRSGYRWLMENYNEGDEVYVFGFSRGAFTARSLVGLIARCGLLKPEAPMSFTQVFERYQKGDEVRPIYRLRYLARHSETDFDFEEKVLLKHSWYHPHLVKMVGVWDTVGSIGIPFGRIKGISSGTLKFHNTHLSRAAEHSYQALAIDEMRHPYWAILWTRFIPNTPDPPSDADEQRIVEQRWFSGAHSNVGGGYRNDLMPHRPLAWLQEKAACCGLDFRSTILLDEEDYQSPVRDSYAEFLGGLWKMIPFPYFRRYVRWIQSNPVAKKNGSVETVNERIDLSVFHRCRADQFYRPKSLMEWSNRKKLDLEDIVNCPEKYAWIWSPAEVGRKGPEGPRKKS